MGRPRITSTVNVQSMEVSSASPVSSPSPCAAWPSPTNNNAPGWNTGRQRVEPSAEHRPQRHFIVFQLLGGLREPRYSGGHVKGPLATPKCISWWRFIRRLHWPHPTILDASNSRE